MRARQLQKLPTLFLLIAAALCFAPQIRAQDSDDGDDSDEPSKPFVNLGLSINPDDTARVTLSAFLPLGSAKELVPEIETLLSCKLQQEQGKTYESQVFIFQASCKLDTAKSGLLRTKTISLSRLTEAVRSHGAEYFSLQVYLPDSEASETLPPAPPPAFPMDKIPSRVRKQIRLAAMYMWTDLDAVPSVIRIQYGYRQATLARRAAILVGFLLLPLILVSWLGRRALDAPADRAPTVWFSYMRWLSWILNFSLIVWYATVETLHCEDLLKFVLSPEVTNYKWLPTAIYLTLLWCTPVVIWISCLVLSKKVQEKLRGVSWTHGELALQALYSFCGSFIPLAMWIGALISFASGAYRIAIGLFVAALVVKLFAKGKLAKLLGMQPHALTSGDLRDVAFAIAQKLRVPLQQIYLIPSGKGRMANAFARTGNTIAFTDYLLNHMSKREVNFVVAHELTHLQKKHPNKLAGIATGIAVGFGMFLGTFRSFLEIPPYMTYGAIIIVCTLVTYTFTRRFEYEADAGAVGATNDPHAAISALFKLAQLNLHPLQWSEWSEKWITHPSMMRRAKAIAARAQIPEVSIPEIAARGVEPALHYVVPNDAQMKAKVLSTARKAKNLGWAVLLLLGIALLPPAICAFAIQTWPSFVPYQYLVYGGGFAIAIALYLYVMNFMSAWRLRPLVERMKGKLDADGAVQADAWGGIPVGLAPADRPRVYEGLTHWDLGFLFVRSDRVCYLGEEAAFAVRCDQVTDLRLGPGNPSWIRGQRIYIAWKDEERRAAGVFSIAAAYPDSAKKLSSRTAELFQQLNRWRSAKAASRPLPEALAKLESPQLREVTSQAPGALLKGDKLVKELFLTAILAAMVAALFGLPFHLMPSLTRISLPGQTALPGAGAGWFVVAAALAIRLFQIAPLFFFEDAPAISVAPVTAATPPVARTAVLSTAQPENAAQPNTAPLFEKK